MASVQVTISLPEDVYQRAERFSRLINRDLASVLADTVGSSLPPLSDQVETLPAIADFPDQAVLDLANSWRSNSYANYALASHIYVRSSHCLKS